MSAASRNLLDIRKGKREEPRKEKTQPSSRGKKPVRLKVRRRRQKLLFGCICLMAAAGLVGLLGGATHIQQFAINDVLILGAQKLAPDAVITAVQHGLSDDGFRLFSKKNMFLYPKGNIENALSSSFPRIRKVKVERESMLSQAVIVTLEERTPYARWCEGGIADASHGAGGGDTCYVIDQGGFIYAPAEGEEPKTPYKFRKGLIPGEEAIGQTFLKGRVQGIVLLLGDLASAGFIAEGATVETEKDYTIALEKGPRLLVSFDMTSEDIIHNLQTALKADSLRDKFETLEYVDLRFGNRVYYK